MNIDDLTIGQAKALAAQFGGGEPLDNGMVGKYVICRCTAAGVHAGVLEKQSGHEVVLNESRRLWYWKSNKGSFLSGVARDGLDSASKIGGPIRVHLIDVCETIECTREAEASIREQVTHERD